VHHEISRRHQREADLLHELSDKGLSIGCNVNMIASLSEACRVWSQQKGKGVRKVFTLLCETKHFYSCKKTDFHFLSNHGSSLVRIVNKVYQLTNLICLLNSNWLYTISCQSAAYFIHEISKHRCVIKCFHPKLWKDNNAHYRFFLSFLIVTYHIDKQQLN